MLRTLKKLFADLTDEAPAPFADDDYRLAATALLVHITTVDGVTSEQERARLHSLVMDRFALDDAAAEDLIAAAVTAESDAIDMYQFTSLLKRTLDEDGRRRIVEMMWQLVYADGRLNEFEDNVIWRAADLLAVSSRDRIALRRQVAAESVADDEVPNG
jgi:uncharacterized tellurite resistance protein B-like protein